MENSPQVGPWTTLGGSWHLPRLLTNWAHQELSTMAKFTPRPGSQGILDNGWHPSLAKLLGRSQSLPGLLMAEVIPKNLMGMLHFFLVLWHSIEIPSTRERPLKRNNFFFSIKKNFFWGVLYGQSFEQISNCSAWCDDTCRFWQIRIWRQRWERTKMFYNVNFVWSIYVCSSTWIIPKSKTWFSISGLKMWIFC